MNKFPEQQEGPQFGSEEERGEKEVDRDNMFVRGLYRRTGEVSNSYYCRQRE